MLGQASQAARTHVDMSPDSPLEYLTSRILLMSDFDQHLSSVGEMGVLGPGLVVAGPPKVNLVLPVV